RERRRVDVHGHCAGEVVDAVDAITLEGERVAGVVAGRAPPCADPEELAGHGPRDHVNAATGAALVVEAALPTLPPPLDPGVRVPGAPERHCLARAASVERFKVDKRRSPYGDYCTGIRVERAGRADRGWIDGQLHGAHALT